MHRTGLNLASVLCIGHPITMHGMHAELKIIFFMCQWAQNMSNTKGNRKFLTFKGPGI